MNFKLNRQPFETFHQPLVDEVDSLVDGFKILKVSDV